MILINPKSTKFGIFERYVPLSVPIGIGHLAGSLIFRQKKVEIIDEHIKLFSRDLLEDPVRKVSPPYIFGVSTLTACVKRSYEIVHAIKSLYPDSKIILGGIHPTVLSEQVLENSEIDFVLKGEAEETLVQLYDALKNGSDYSEIKGLSFKQNNKIIHNQAAQLPDLSKLPLFPYHLFEKNLNRYNFGFISSSRGCPYNCIFCSQRSVSGRTYRYFPADTVIEEIRLLVKKYGQTHINFVDDNFTANKQRVMELSEMMIKEKFYQDATFDCQTRADSINEEMLILLKKAGFRVIDFGIETASQRLMAMLDKKETVEQNIQGVRLAKKHGFSVSGTFILGLPTETREERWQAYRLAKELELDYVRFNNATPYPGTRLYEIAEEEGRLFVEKDWSNLNACGSLVQDSFTTSRLPYVPLTCDEKTLQKDIVKANLLFSLSPGRILKLLTKRVGPAGWFYLPKRWYFNPKEWSCLIRLGLKLIKSLIKIYI